jgi:hypothetical protein
MTFFPDDFKTWVDVVTKIVTVFFGLGGGLWALVQYVAAGRIRAAETLLKMEDEFRAVFQTFEKLEIPLAYEREIAPVLQAENRGEVPSDQALKMLIDIDRSLRFLYLCVVLDGTLKGNAGHALRGAYYHYIAILLPEQKSARPELLTYSTKYYPRLTAWIEIHAAELRKLVAPRGLGLLA